MARLLLLSLILLAGCEQPPLLERLRTKGVLHIATVAGPLTCQLGEHGPEGAEYELARAFARRLNLKPRFHVYPTRSAALEALEREEVEMVAAARQPTTSDRRRFLLSRPWHLEPLVFVGTMGARSIKTLKTPPDEAVAVPPHSVQEEVLSSLTPPFPFRASAGQSEEALLERVDRGAERYTLANRLLLQIWQKVRPRLVAGALVPPARGFRWYFSRLHDPSLRDAADRFLGSEEGRKLALALLAKQRDDLPVRDFVTLRDFWKQVQDRLPAYEPLFRKAAEETGIDWRLLAAIGYQESHWRARAVSPTGVKGIMMLTLPAARREGVTNRFDPAQSIRGGARHLIWMEKRIPERIQGLDRLWLTLASYNIGYGHLEDARILTQRGGGDPDRWRDVKRFLPLLSRKAYYRTVKHGKARGGEPVAYVENIRYFFHLLVWWDNRRRGLDCTSEDYPRLALKNWRRRSPQLSASTPPSTTVR